MCGQESVFPLKKHEASNYCVVDGRLGISGGWIPNSAERGSGSSCTPSTVPSISNICSQTSFKCGQDSPRLTEPSPRVTEPSPRLTDSQNPHPDSQNPHGILTLALTEPAPSWFFCQYIAVFFVVIRGNRWILKLVVRHTFRYVSDSGVSLDYLFTCAGRTFIDFVTLYNRGQRSPAESSHLSFIEPLIYRFSGFDVFSLFDEFHVSVLDHKWLSFI